MRYDKLNEIINNIFVYLNFLDKYLDYFWVVIEIIMWYLF